MRSLGSRVITFNARSAGKPLFQGEITMSNSKPYNKALTLADQIKIYGPWPELTSQIFDCWREMIDANT
jgi:Na+-transporting NADH:ubiquinone oxidoreductase subunit NqrF